MANHDDDLRSLIEDGSLGANELRVFLEANEVELGELINNLVTTGEVVVKHLDGIEQLLVIYPYVVEGGYTVVSKSPGTGLYDAHFGMVLTTGPARVPRGLRGHRPPLAARRQQPADEGGHPLHGSRVGDQRPRCPEHPGAPAGDRLGRRRTSRTTPRPGAVTSDPAEIQRLERGGSVAPRSLGEETWKWLYLQPLLTRD